MAVLSSRALRTRRVRACAAMMAALLSSAWPAAAAPAQGIALEYAVKANFLYKFGPFVDWPPHAFDSAVKSVAGRNSPLQAHHGYCHHRGESENRRSNCSRLTPRLDSDSEKLAIAHLLNPAMKFINVD